MFKRQETKSMGNHIIQFPAPQISGVSSFGFILNRKGQESQINLSDAAISCPSDFHFRSQLNLSSSLRDER